MVGALLLRCHPDLLSIVKMMQKSLSMSSHLDRSNAPLVQKVGNHVTVLMVERVLNHREDPPRSQLAILTLKTLTLMIPKSMITLAKIARIVLNKPSRLLTRQTKRQINLRLKSKDWKRNQKKSATKMTTSKKNLSSKQQTKLPFKTRLTNLRLTRRMALAEIARTVSNNPLRHSMWQTKRQINLRLKSKNWRRSRKRFPTKKTNLKNSFRCNKNSQPLTKLPYKAKLINCKLIRQMLKKS